MKRISVTDIGGYTRIIPLDNIAQVYQEDDEPEANIQLKVGELILTNHPIDLIDNLIEDASNAS
jgi:hypothetical protein